MSYIEREALLAKQKTLELPDPNGGEYHIDIIHAYDVRNAPLADVVEVVRCKDCIHAQNMPLGLCYLHTEPYDNARGYKGEAVCVEPNDFCSCGERRTK